MFTEIRGSVMLISSIFSSSGFKPEGQWFDSPPGNRGLGIEDDFAEVGEFRGVMLLEMGLDGGGGDDFADVEGHLE
jgi:hypothetical protein